MGQVATAVATVLKQHRQSWLHRGHAGSKSYTRVVGLISSWIWPIGGLSNAAPANAKSRLEPRYVRRQGLAAQDEIRQPRRLVFAGVVQQGLDLGAHGGGKVVSRSDPGQTMPRVPIAGAAAGSGGQVIDESQKS
jgi:hypothetical protein